jgi:succinoglycan biosynthesis transport protein ExoP
MASRCPSRLKLRDHMTTELSPYQISRSGPPPQPHFTHDPFSSEVNIKEYLRIIRKYRRMILALMFAVAIIVAAWRLARTPQYQAISTILIQPQSPQVLTDTKNFNHEQFSSSGEYDYYRTEFDLLRSDSLAAQVIRDYGLQADPLLNPVDQRPGLIGSAIASVRGELSGLAGAENGSAVAGSAGIDGVKPAVIKAYLSRLTVAPVRGTRLVMIGFTTPNRELSARFANAHVQTFIRQGLELQAQTGKNVEEFLQQKLAEVKDQVEKSEAALNAYRRSRGIVTLEGNGNKESGGESPLIQRLGQLNTQLTEASSKRITLETQHQMIARGDFDSLPEAISNPVIQSLKEQVAQLTMQYASLSNRYNPGYHPLDDLGARLDASRQALKAETAKVAVSVDADYRAAVANETKIADEIDHVRSQTLALNDASLQEAVLERQVDANRQLYRSVLERMNEISVASEVPASNISVVDRAHPPLAPAGPWFILLLSFSVSAAGFVGIALAFFIESMDDTFKVGEEVLRYLGLPSLGVVPDFAKLNGRANNGYGYLPSRKRRETSEITASSESGNGELLVSHGVFSTSAEVYRAIRSAIMFSRAGGAPKTILVTSSTTGEGKTITAVNIATAFAQTGARTLLVDTDFRRSRCHEILQIESAIGLSELLVRQIDLSGATSPSKVPGLSFMGSGTLPPNPSELLASPEMRSLIAQLGRTYDYVIMDSAPVLPVSDSVGLSTMVEAVLMVAGGETSRRLVRETCQRLDHVGARIIGVIVNRVDVVSNSYHRYNNSSYYYSYQPRHVRAGKPDVSAAGGTR